MAGGPRQVATREICPVTISPHLADSPASDRADTFTREWGERWLSHQKLLRYDSLIPAALSDELLAAAGSAGLLALEVSVSDGGLGASFSDKCAVASHLGRVDLALAMTILNTHNIAALLSRKGSERVRSQWLAPLITGKRVGCTAITEPLAGSDAAAIQTTAVRKNGSWRLNGEKAWIINADRADCVHVYAQTDPGSGAAGIASFIIDTHRVGFERLPPAASTPARALGTGGFRLNDYCCGEDELIAPPGLAFRAAMGSINGARIYVAAICCGMVQACVDTVIAYGNQRKSFGSPLVGHQGWRWSLSQAAVELSAACALVAHAARRVDEGADVRTEAASAKVVATQLAQRQIPSLMHLMGAIGLLDAQPFMRHLASAQIATLTDGATEMLLDRIGYEFVDR